MSLHRLFKRSRAKAQVGAAGTVCASASHGIVRAAMVRTLASGDALAPARFALEWVESEPYDSPATFSGERLADPGPSVGAALARIAQRRGLPREATLVWQLSATQYQRGVLEAPSDMPQADWPEALRWTLAEGSDDVEEEADVTLLSVPGGASYRMQPSVLAAACAHSTLEDVAAMFRSLSRDVAAVDIIETAQRNLTLLQSGVQAAHASVRLDDASACVVITWQGQLLWMRRFDTDARALLRAAVDASVDVALESFCLEIGRTIEAFERFHNQVSLARVVLLPFPGAQHVATHLARIVDVPSTVLGLSDVFEVSAGVTTEQIEPALLVIGGALRGCRLQRVVEEGEADLPQSLSLAPEQIHSRGTVRRRRPVPALAAAAVLSLAVPLCLAAGTRVYAWRIDRNVMLQTAELASKTREAARSVAQASASEIAREQREIAAAREGLGEMQTLAMHAKVAGPARLSMPVDLLEGLAGATRAGVWLTDVQLDLRRNALLIQGRTSSPVLVADYLQSPSARKVLGAQAIDNFRVIAEEDSTMHRWELRRGTPGAPAIASAASAPPPRPVSAAQPPAPGAGLMLPPAVATDSAAARAAGPAGVPRAPAASSAAPSPSTPPPPVVAPEPERARPAAPAPRLEIRLLAPTTAPAAVGGAASGAAPALRGDVAPAEDAR